LDDFTITIIVVKFANIPKTAIGARMHATAMAVDSEKGRLEPLEKMFKMLWYFQLEVVSYLQTWSILAAFTKQTVELEHKLMCSFPRPKLSLFALPDDW